MKRCLLFIILCYLNIVILHGQNSNNVNLKSFYLTYICSDFNLKNISIQSCSFNDSIRYNSLFNRGFEDESGCISFFEMEVVINEVYHNNARIFFNSLLGLDENMCKDFYYKSFSKTIVFIVRDEDVKKTYGKLEKLTLNQGLIIFEHYFTKGSQDEEDFYFVCKSFYTLKEFRKVMKEEELITIRRNNK